MYGDIHLLHLSRLADTLHDSVLSSVGGVNRGKTGPFLKGSKGSCEWWSLEFEEQNKMITKPIAVPCLKRIFRFFKLK